MPMQENYYMAGSACGGTQKGFVVIGDFIRGSLDAFYYLSLFFGIILIITYLYYWVNKNDFDEEKRLKIFRFKTFMLKATVISIIIGILSVVPHITACIYENSIKFLGYTMENKAEAISCIICFVLYIIIFIILGNHIINKNQHDKDKKLK